MSEEIRIESLEFQLCVRFRPGMYVGDIVEPSVILREVVDNGTDEILLGHANKIHIYHGEENWVVDNGRGVPVYEIKKEGEMLGMRRRPVWSCLQTDRILWIFSLLPWIRERNEWCGSHWKGFRNVRPGLPEFQLPLVFWMKFCCTKIQ